jgi:non-specific serine/threonine protein kinase/serine/threonine-protein kinase
MTIQAWERVKELLHQAMQLDPEQRAPFLDKACSSDLALRAEVESLLLAGEGVPAGFLQSASPGAESDRIDAAGGLEAGQIFAQHFQLVRKLGEGGMGQIWLAEQTSPVRRQIALKLIKAGMYDQAVLQRFQAERQSLAIMDHPAIAKVFDAGSTPAGQPYFVMEYVPGLPITNYCDQKRLSARERLTLMVKVCEGVQHAHLKAIIHRDLKPSNILVVEVDGKPVPRIIDFGIAKAISQQSSDQTFTTRAGGMVGTPGYMSPEQADPSVPDIDTRTDVYSLGVVLYELLTGALPFDVKLWKTKPFHEVLRQLHEDDPPSPSTRISRDPVSTATAANRTTDPRQLASLLRGDLDCITLKALEKDRSRRYGTPSEVSADIGRYLRNEPVTARPASAAYRAEKYVQRHKFGVATVSAMVLLLIAFGITQAVQLHRITQERDRANRERDRATRVTDFMTGMFKVSDPSEARGNSITAREILDKASKDMGTGLAKDPEVQSQMMEVMARTYTNLGLFARSHELAKSALDVQLRVLGPDDPKTLESMAQLGWVLDREGHYPEAEKLERQALADQRRVLGPEAPLTLETTDRLAFVLLHEGHYDATEKLERQAIEIATRTLGPESAQTLQSMQNLGGALWSQSRYADAEQEYRQLLDVTRRVNGPDYPQTLAAMNNLALSVEAQGRLAEAEPLYREALDAYQRVLGPEHQNTILAMENFAELLANEGHLAEAEKLDRDALGLWLRTAGPEHPGTLWSQSNLAGVLLKQGRVHEAEKLQRETLATQLRVFGPQHRGTLLSQASLAGILNREGHYAQAEKIARQAFEIQLRTIGPLHTETLDSLQRLGTALAYSHRYDEASKLFRDVIEKGSNSPAQGNPFSVWYSFACVAAAANQPDEALQYLNEAFNRGYKGVDGLMADDDLKNLHPNPKFQQFVATLKHPPATVQTR